MKLYASSVLSVLLIVLQLIDFEGSLTSKYALPAQERLEEWHAVMAMEPVITPSQAALQEIMERGPDWKRLEDRNTLIRFQAENNITVDGIYGPVTERTLTDTGKVITDRIPNDMRSEELFVAIDITRRILTVYQYGEVVHKYPIAVGEGDLTPETQTQIANKVVNPYWAGAGQHDPVPGGDPDNPLGPIWLGLELGGGSTYGIHGNAAPFSIGRSVSLGCIRMINEDVAFLYELIPVGTNVWIATTATLESWGIVKQIHYE